MAELAVGEWELDGQVFGCGKGVDVGEVDFGSADMTTQDWDRPGRDGHGMGLDHLRAPEWQFTLAGLAAQAPHFKSLQSLAGAWRYAPSRTSGGLSVLRYRLGGQETRRVYGRPRRFDLADAHWAWHFDWATAVASFKLADPVHYTDAAKTITLTPASPSAQIVNAGTAPVPFEATFYGAWTAIKLTWTGGSMQFSTAAKSYETVKVDTRQGSAIFTDDKGASSSFAGALSVASTLTGRIPAGVSTLGLLGSGFATHTKVEVAFRDGWASP